MVALVDAIDSYGLDYDLILTSLAVYYGNLGHLALEINERLLAAAPSFMSFLEKNNLDKEGWKLFTQSPIAPPGKEDPYGSTFPDNIYSPVGRKIEIEISKAKHEARAQQKKINEREIGALKDKVTELTAENQQLKEYLKLGKERQIKLIDDSNELVLLALKEANPIIKAEASKISYAACADHVREKLALHGEDTHILNNFPRLDKAMMEVKEYHNKSKEHYNNLIAEKNGDGPRKLRSLYAAEIFHELIVILEESMESNLADINEIKAYYSPELDQLKEVDCAPATKQDPDSQQATDEASDQSPKVDKETPAPPESPSMG